ncbi:hypothetical protein [Winogradskyella helgolandensis]|uniref:hypothetical protein n=1 Tax=Winogradskyella helgolandensis TaxID=2697010 RepID=UPI0015CA8BDE|nr:hypothetical protein [Winogradskyella helgolandensis]
MKYLILPVFILSIFICCNAQTNEFTFSYENFEKEIIGYEPKQNEVSDKKFEHSVFVLNEVKKDVNNDALGFNRADYFNILSSFLTLNESKKNILIAYNKFKKSEGSCEYFTSSIFFKSSKFDIIRDDIEKQIKICQDSNLKEASKFNLKTYSSENNLDYNLVELISNISKLDQEYRSAEEKIYLKKQPELDKRNQKLIDSLFNKYQKYIGKTLVGEKFESVMWSVIQHSNLEMMEKYLPIIQKAVQDDDLHQTPFKMLIDRIYSQKENYQIFGSQGGVELASEEIRKKVIATYKIE